MNRTPSVIVACLLACAVLGAQAPQAPPRPTFQLSVSYVDVDVTVTDAAGNFVTGLTRDDFQLFEDGKPQKIDAFSFVELPIERPDRFRLVDHPIRADVRSNRDASSGRVYVIVLDDLDVSALRSNQVRKSAREFIEKYFGPHDIAAVVSTSGRKESAQEFTSDPALLLAAIDNFIGQRLRSAEAERIDAYYQNQLSTSPNAQTQTGQPSQQTEVPDLTARLQSFDPSNLERGQRAVGVLNSLRSLAEFVDGVRGRRKALLFFSEGIDYPMAGVFDSPSGGEIIRATQEAINAAAHANVNFFTLDPRGLIGMTTDLLEMTKSGPPDYAGTDPTKPTGTPFTGTQALMDEIRLTQDSLRTLADGTGGFAAVDTNSFTDVFDRVVQANSRYYLLGYTPPSHPRDGRFHRIEVRVNRPGLKAVARRGYPSPSSSKTPEERKQDELNKRALESRKGGSTDTSVELRAALNNPVQQPGLTLSVQAVPFKGSPKEASVVLAVELEGSRLEFAQQPNALFADTLEFSFFALDDEGKAQRGTRMALNLAVRPETYQRVKALGLRVNSRTALAPGRYQLRVGARDPLTGAAGTVFYDVRVPDFTKDPLMMSGLLLSSLGAPDILTPQRDPAVEKLLGAPATSRREFAQNETLTFMAELYNNPPTQQPRQIDVSVRLLAETGGEAFAARDSLNNGAGGGQSWTVYSYASRIPLKDVAPGRYLLSVEARDRTSTDRKATALSETVVTITPAR